MVDKSASISWTSRATWSRFTVLRTRYSSSLPVSQFICDMGSKPTMVSSLSASSYRKMRSAKCMLVLRKSLYFLCSGHDLTFVATIRIAARHFRISAISSPPSLLLGLKFEANVDRDSRTDNPMEFCRRSELRLGVSGDIDGDDGGGWSNESRRRSAGSPTGSPSGSNNGSHNTNGDADLPTGATARGAATSGAAGAAGAAASAAASTAVTSRVCTVVVSINPSVTSLPQLQACPMDWGGGVIMPVIVRRGARVWWRGEELASADELTG
mmetsp:Transcript_45769/g.62348  ORF Transcript_45769/g.62348 Transcript_45769/m.62348 type:complete len:269 (+) Transcript_45769:363-1169(+)